MAQERDWGPGGYDRVIGDRWIYAMCDRDSGLVKVGMVLDEQRIERRFKEVQRRHKSRSLELLARSKVVGVNHEQVEHIESATRLWLTRAKGFEFVGEVDWLMVSGNYDFAVIQSDLNEAVQAAQSFGLV